VSGIDASVLTISPGRPLRASVTTFGALVGSGFRRYATYRQATIAGSFTNIVFGFLRCYVLLAVAASVERAGQVDRAPGGAFLGDGRQQHCASLPVTPAQRADAGESSVRRRKRSHARKCLKVSRLARVAPSGPYPRLIEKIFTSDAAARSLTTVYADAIPVGFAGRFS